MENLRIRWSRKPEKESSGELVEAIESSMDHYISGRTNLPVMS